MSKKKVTVYLDIEQYDKLMNKVFARMKEKQQFRGIITEILSEALDEYFENHA